MKCPRCRRKCAELDFGFKNSGKRYKTCNKCRKSPDEKRQFDRKKYMKDYYQNNKEKMDNAVNSRRFRRKQNIETQIQLFMQKYC